MLAVDTPSFLATYQQVFGGDYPELYNLFIAEGDLKSFVKGRSLFREGEDAEGFYWILSGHAKVCKCLSTAEEHILTLVGPGDFTGLTSCLNGGRYSKGCVAIGSTVQALYIPREAFLDWFRRHPGLSLPVLKQLESKIDRIENRATYFMRKTIDQRLAHALVILGDKFGLSQDMYLNVKLSPQELASFIGTTRTTIYRILKRFEEAHLIDIHNKRIKILDGSALQGISA